MESALYSPNMKHHLNLSVLLSLVGFCFYEIPAQAKTKISPKTSQVPAQQDQKPSAQLSHPDPIEKEESQPESPSRNTNLYVAPLFLLAGGVDVGADFRLNEHFTLGPEFGYYGADAVILSLSGYSIGPKLQYYFSGNAIADSFFLAGSVSYVRVRAEVFGLAASSSGIGITGLGGYIWVWDSGFTMELGAGGGVLLGSGFYPGLSFKIGYAF